MRIIPLIALCACLAAAGCETMDDGGNGYITHSSHSLTSAERAGIQTAMNNYMKTQTGISGLKASYRLSNNSVSACGYVTVMVRGTQSPPALFAGTFVGPGSTHFVPYRIPGKGQDPQRIAQVRAICQGEQINI